MMRLFGNRRKRKEKFKQDRAKKSWLLNSINRIPNEVFNLTIDNVLYSKEHDKIFFIHHIPGLLILLRREMEEGLGKDKGGSKWMSVRHIHKYNVEHLDDRMFSFYCATLKYNQDIGVDGNMPISMFDIGEDKKFTILEKTRTELWEEQDSLESSELKQFMNLEDLN
jgi:hypothetical protein